VKHILGDKKGFDYKIEASTLNDLNWRGRPCDQSGTAERLHDRGSRTRNPIEVRRRLDRYGRRTLHRRRAKRDRAIYPSISLYWYWNQSGKAIMR
jgi:hypothetical protein